MDKLIVNAKNIEKHKWKALIACIEELDLESEMVQN